ncbi:MAG: hypothetical protein U9R19_18715 [Bacteroidota bacterium]|nr:hypothetical protein [Bacteroidota bacterium]
MKNKLIAVFIILLIIIVVYILIFDFNSAKIENRLANPYEFNVEELKKVDNDLIHYHESKQIKIISEISHGIACHNNLIYLLQDNVLKIIDKNGHVKNKIDLNDEPSTLCVKNDGHIIIAFKNYFRIYADNLNLIMESERENEKSVFTSVACRGNIVFIADAGNRRVMMFDEHGKKKGEFGGKTEKDSKHGFIIPSAYFDLAINKDEELWVVNPGKHQFQQYSLNGRFIGFWERTSMTITGFSGCCNPAHFCFLPNGDFVTSEKGMVRIKVHKPSGELKSVVAAPENFAEGKHAPDICCDEKGNIIALDYDRNMIRIFELN